VGRALHVTAAVTPGAVLLGFGFALAVGIVFGFWPAAQGSRLDPIEALRHD
jgi:putative ABC transport system permease protein